MHSSLFSLLRVRSGMETSTLALLLIATTSLIIAMVFPRKNHFNPAKKHCYIGGGSEGLGLSLAQQLVAKGAHVSIVSRSPEKLKLAIQEIEVRSCPATEQRCS